MSVNNIEVELVDEENQNTSTYNDFQKYSTGRFKEVVVGGTENLTKGITQGVVGVADGVGTGAKVLVGGVGTGAKVLVGGGVDLVTGVGEFTKDNLDMIGNEVR